MRLINIKKTNTFLNFENCDRICAILIGKNKKIYEGETHQECFIDYCHDLGISYSNWNLDNWDDGIKLAELTHDLFKDESEKLYGFDIWSKDEKEYLVPHFEHNLIECLDIIKEYSKRNNYIVCIYPNCYSLKGNIVVL